MVPELIFNPIRIAHFLTIATIALLTASCGHTQASPPEVPVDAVMSTIHEYGRGRAGLLSPGNTEKPTENDGLYRAHINSLLVQGDFAQLEKIAEQNRTEKGRLLGGYWENYDFFQATGYGSPVRGSKDSDYQDHMVSLKKWIAGYPESTAARISLATLYLNYASFARGSGYADSVGNSQWNLFHQRTVLGKQSLLEAAGLKERDPYWYAAMQQVAHNEGWGKTRARDLLDQAIAFEPGYYHFYRLYAQYLLPQWYGQPGDIQAFAEEISEHVPEPNGSTLYFQIVSSLACYCQEAMAELPHLSYPKVRQGYTNLTQLYGTSDLTANRFAYFATSFKDQPSAREAFTTINEMDLSIWYTKDIFDDARTWAGAP
jgi:Domain of unknown function (DUF4034)